MNDIRYRCQIGSMFTFYQLWNNKPKTKLIKSAFENIFKKYL